MIGYELSRGFAYRRINHPVMHWYTTTIPLLLTVVSTAIILLIPERAPLLGKDGLLSQALVIISTLPGFYFAGLAAVATFNGLNMDAVITAPAPSIKVKLGGIDQSVDLSRRQFLSYLFSYLVLISFALCIGSLMISAITPSIFLLHSAIIKFEHGELIWALGRFVCVAIYIAGASSLLVTTLHGMFFLTERIHQP